MFHHLGIADRPWQTNQIAQAVVIDTDKLASSHMVIAGMTGTGKSTQVMTLLRSAAKAGIECDVFDPHEELHRTEGCKAVKFSRATLYGYNPLTLNLDPHSGGPAAQIDWIISTINQASRQLGNRQESALRSLLGEAYYLRGITNDPSTWHRAEITESHYDSLIEARNFSALRDYYPTLRDVISLAKRKLKQLSTGANGQCINALDQVERLASRVNSLQVRTNKSVAEADRDKLAKQLALEKSRLIDMFATYVNSIETGKEYAEFKKYSDPATLQSVTERLELMLAYGICRSNPPPWGDALIRCYHTHALDIDEQRMLLFTRCEQILRQAFDRGKSDTLRHLIVVDEGHLYHSDDDLNPLNRIAKEGRKYGLGLVMSSQSPTHFSEDFLTSCSVIILTGLHNTFWDSAVKKLGIDRSALENVRARETVALKLQLTGVAHPRFTLVNVDRATVNAAARTAR